MRQPSAAPAMRHAERCYFHLKSLLLDGGLDPGDEVSIEELRRSLCTSRQPVMDAVKRLAVEGFITITPQVGCQVTVPDPDQVDDFYKLFAGSESVITRLAAERRSEAEARSYARLAAEIADEAAHAGDPASRDPTYHHLIRRRQQAIHEMARSPVITEIASAMWDRSNFYIRAALGSAYFSSHVRRLHREIDDAIISGDGAEAESATRRYIDGARPVIAEQLRRKREVER